MNEVINSMVDYLVMFSIIVPQMEHENTYVIRVWFLTMLLSGAGVFLWIAVDDVTTAFYVAFFGTLIAGIFSIPTIIVFVAVHKILMGSPVTVITHKLILSAVTSLGVCLTIWIALGWVFEFLIMIYILTSGASVFICKLEKDEQTIARKQQLEDDVPLDEL
jgi:hypothetical protein